MNQSCTLLNFDFSSWEKQDCDISVPVAGLVFDDLYNTVKLLYTGYCVCSRVVLLGYYTAMWNLAVRMWELGARRALFFACSGIFSPLFKCLNSSESSS